MRYPRYLLALALLCFLSLLSPPAEAQAPAPLKPKPVVVSQIAKTPASYLDRQIRVGGYPTAVKPVPGTDKFTAHSSGLKIELTPAAKAYLDRIKPSGKRPVFNATLRRRGGEHVLVFESGSRHP